MDVTVIITTRDQDFPGGTVAGNFRYTISDSNNVEIATKDDPGLSVMFPSIGAGSYTAGAQRMDSAGNPLGSKITAAFVVAPTGVSVPVPDTISVSLSG